MKASPKSKPLSDKTVLATGSPKLMQELIEGLLLMGAEAIPFSTIEIREIEDKSHIDQTVRSLEQYDWIIFTSAYGARFFLQYAVACGISPDNPDMPNICAIGTATAAEARRYGCRIELVPDRFAAEGVLESLAKYAGGMEQLSGKRILIPRAKEGRELLPSALTAAGASVDVAACYETVQAQPDENALKRLREHTPDVIIFTSPSTVKNFFKILGSVEAKRALTNSVIAALGPITGHAVESFGRTPDIIPDESTIHALLRAIEKHYADEKCEV
jgi:uroporphyrinogen III methyltransferase/synthase